MSEKITIAVLDYNRPEESRNLLESIKNNCQFEKEVLFLDNGSDEKYSLQFLQEGLIDRLIINREGNGCGNAMFELYQTANHSYVMLLQCDQEISCIIDQSNIEYFIDLLNNGYSCIDLNGNQGHGKFSDRGHLMKRDLYLSIPQGTKGELGGPGKYNFNRYTEEYIGNFFIENKLKIAHIPVTLVKDCGKWSERETLHSGLFLHRTDTKEMWVKKIPTERESVYPNLTDYEWELVLSGKWIGGTIPEQERTHSFRCWD